MPTELPAGIASTAGTAGTASTAGAARNAGADPAASLDLVVVGLGYVGLPLAARACAAGLSVAGLDVSPRVTAGLAAGRSHVPDVPDVEVRRMTAAGFRTTTDPTVIAGADTVVICVPTGLTADGRPDLADVTAASAAIATRLRPGMLVVLESTSYPGTTEELVRPILQRGGLVAGVDFYLAHSPERVDPGNQRFGLRNTPKIVSGLTPLCAKRAAAFYEQLVESVVTARGLREAEMAKLLENAYRMVNIALANEIALCCDRMGIDVWDVIRCAATKPFGFQEFHPGPGVGGHCIPIDPVYLAHAAQAAGVPCPLLSAARRVNAAMPGHVVEQARRRLAGSGRAIAGARVLLLGVSYKADVADVRETPAAEVVRLLRGLGADVQYHDPHVELFTVDGVGVPRVPAPSAGGLDTELRAADLTILLQAHRCYDPEHLVATARALLDTRGHTAAAGAPECADHAEPPIPTPEPRPV
jgi:UDP-N-acetyl-D-glucosamine dehydrogenase